MNFMGKQAIKIVIVIAIIALSLTVYYFNDGINLGLDLEGGTQIVMEARPDDEDQIVTAEQMNTIRTIIENRVNEMGLSEPVVQTIGANRLNIELPAVDEPHEAIEAIGRTALLTVRDQQGQVLLTGEHVVDATALFDQYNRPVISFELDREGGSKFAEITNRYLGREIGFYLDDDQLTMGTVQDVIRDQGQISGFPTLEEASETAMLIREGALPVPLYTEETRHVGPTLGEISLQQSIMAGLIGLLIVATYMVFYYRFPGFIVALVLIIYGIVFLGTLSGLGATLTLPGIAGLVLSIGMAVDANIIIYERIKDEMKSGKKLKTAVSAGFKRAYRTIIDANVTTLITALILAYYTTGSIQGFAIVLIIGIVVSMFTAFVVTRMIIDLFLNTPFLKSEKAFGVHRGLLK